MKVFTLLLLIALICMPAFAGRRSRGFRGRDRRDRDDRPDRYDGGDYREDDYPEDGRDGRDGEEDPEEEDDRRHSRRHKKRHGHKNRDEGSDEPEEEQPEENAEEDLPSNEDKPATPVVAPVTTSSSSSSSQTTTGTLSQTKSSSGTIIYGTVPVQPAPENTVAAPAEQPAAEQTPAEETPEDETPIVDTPDDAPEATSKDSNLDSFSQECLNIHNDERASLGIQAMTWSEDLAAAAKTWAEELADRETLKHSDNRVHIGENVGRRSHKNNVDSVPLLIGAWLDEKKDFKNGEYPDIATTGNVHDVGHYSQMIWSTSTELGCAMANGGGRDYMVCQYGPSGNRHGKSVY